MALKNKQKIHRTAKGKQVDMDILRQKNELTPAVGNVRVNARGDELGPGGEISRKREEVIREYYENTPNAAVDEAPVKSNKETPVVVEEQPAPAKATKSRAQKKVDEVVNEPTPAELAEFEDDWIEDADGNFVQKGE